MIGNLLQLPATATLTATQKRKLRALRRAQYLETGVYEPAGIRTRQSKYKRVEIFIHVIDDAKKEHRPPRIRLEEQERHKPRAPLFDVTAKRKHDAQLRRAQRV